MKTDLCIAADAESAGWNGTMPCNAQAIANTHQERIPGAKHERRAHLSTNNLEERVSSWSESGTKRLFDFMSVLMVLPVLFPIFLSIALAIRLTSRGPVFFLQKRIAQHQRPFIILKFRTMEHREQGAHPSITTTGNQPFTTIGSLLRWWKLDELPQLLNVLIGDMSLVGPRPKLPEHQLGELRCRPGITGAATIAFACEEQVLAGLPHHRLDDYYHSVILPSKLRLDTEYMARATFLSDLKLIMDTAFRRWDTTAMHILLDVETVEIEAKAQTFEVLTPIANCETTIAARQSLASAD